MQTGLDAGRLAQGVMTGVGFLGAGVIYKEGVNVQGLTTAASVWATAALGLLFGLGEFLPGALGTAAVLATLIVLRWLETWLPSQVYAWAIFRFRVDQTPAETAWRELLAAEGVSLGELSYLRTHDGATIEFQGNLRASRPQAFHDLAVRLRAVDGLTEFELQRISK
jgi:putative Mg2+ transporter-C (MgtC) family protein